MPSKGTCPLPGAAGEGASAYRVGGQLVWVRDPGFDDPTVLDYNLGCMLDVVAVYAPAASAAAAAAAEDFVLAADAEGACLEISAQCGISDPRLTLALPWQASVHDKTAGPRIVKLRTPTIRDWGGPADSAADAMALHDMVSSAPGGKVAALGKKGHAGRVWRTVSEAHQSRSRWDANPQPLPLGMFAEPLGSGRGYAITIDPRRSKALATRREGSSRTAQRRREREALRAEEQKRKNVIASMRNDALRLLCRQGARLSAMLTKAVADRYEGCAPPYIGQGVDASAMEGVLHLACMMGMRKRALAELDMAALCAAASGLPDDETLNRTASALAALGSRRMLAAIRLAKAKQEKKGKTNV